MSRVINQLSDRLLGRLLKQKDAGACVSNYGNPCGCAGAGCNVKRQKLIDCNGVCRQYDIRCYDCVG